MPLDLLGCTREELRRLAAEWGEPAYRGSQLYHALYAERRREFSVLSNLPRPLRARLSEQATVGLPAIARKYLSADGTIRYVLQLAVGQSVETVFMPEARRQTLCLSTQAGCAVDCRFCATATLGLVRNLSAGEIVGQVLTLLEDNRRQLKPQTNVVLMGQGEPLLNYESVIQAVRLLADPNGMNIAVRKITLSTAGIVPGIRRLAEEAVRPKLAVSLNATTDEVRTRIMPINKKYPLGDLLAACRDYPLRPWEQLTVEYVLLGGVNDTREDARRLVRLLAGLRAKVNLIPWNAVAGLAFHPPAEECVAAFRQALTERGLLAFIRRSRGQDVAGACGQLALLAANPQAAAGTLPPG